MSRLTEELLRKRSEHNEGMLTTLEEVSDCFIAGIVASAGVGEDRELGCAM